MDQKKTTYEMLGVSSQKEEVHAAVKNLNQGIFPGAFCKIIADIADNPAYCSLVHADGAGTKSSLAYMMFSETADLSYFEGIVQDSIVMNVDDVLCVGAGTSFLLSNTIGRNKKLISGAVIKTIIEAYDKFIQRLQEFGLPITSCGGETADVGDLVRTLIVDSTLVTRMKRSEVIHPKSIQPGDVIVGLSSFGKANYEDEYNSGIGSNGLTLARHGLLHHDYYKKYQECYSPELDENWTFFGKYSLHDKVPQTNLTVGQAILSPTRTYTPILLELFKIDRSQIHAIFHNTGGGQTKCLKFGESLHYYKNNMFADPPFFKLIQESSQTGWKEMYQVFNMGHRMEIICSEDFAKDFVIRTARKYGVESKIIGVVERSSEKHKNYLTIENLHGKFEYSSK
ncbi:MAG: phosphoribosylformylglycinamidine cyclo-ligase [Candidatus Lokiarchaeota archaeon]|nr:phosphoribosylformylglycinamidine cyclo-ligase [Candidatus Harpocratesius repetitus]